MSYRNIFTVLVSIIMAVGCDDPAATVDETEPYIIPVGDTVITAGPESARLSLQYSLKESDDYSPLFAECGEEWISDWDYSENGTVGFTVSANESGNGKAEQGNDRQQRISQCMAKNKHARRKSFGLCCQHVVLPHHLKHRGAHKPRHTGHAAYSNDKDRKKQMLCQIEQFAQGGQSRVF